MRSKIPEIPAPLWNHVWQAVLGHFDSRGVRGFGRDCGLKSSLSRNRKYLTSSGLVLHGVSKIRAEARCDRSGFLGGLVAKYRHSNAATFDPSDFSAKNCEIHYLCFMLTAAEILRHSCSKCGRSGILGGLVVEYSFLIKDA